MSSGSGAGSRTYRMSKRARKIDSTRERIVEAAVALHGTVGPASTSVVGIAERAGVTRATVYRHFPDEVALFRACSSHWLARQIPPDPSAWAILADPLERLRAGLADLYRFYRAGEGMLMRIYRDKESLPDEHRKGLEERDVQLCALLLSAFPPSEKRRRELGAAVGHAVEFATWHSLCVDHGLSDEEAVGLMVDLVTSGRNRSKRQTPTKTDVSFSPSHGRRP